MVSGTAKKRIVFVITVDWYFVSHRLDLAREAMDEGYEVWVICACTKHRAKIESYGIRVLDWPLSRRALNPFRQVKDLVWLGRNLSRLAPDLIHSVALKPSLYVLAARALKRRIPTVCALGGLGDIFNQKSFKTKLVGTIVRRLFRVLGRSDKVHFIVQNKRDHSIVEKMIAAGPEAVTRLNGVGVNLVDFPLSDLPAEKKCTLPARMLWTKGVDDYIESARSIHEQTPGLAQFELVGDPDPENPAAIPAETLRSFESSHSVVWKGRVSDMSDYLDGVWVVCLPTRYGEGIPKALIEAGAKGRPVVTYDVSGCNELIRDGENGFLCPPGDVEALSARLSQLLTDRQLCRDMGLRARAVAEAEYDASQVNAATIGIWRTLLER